MLPRPDKIVDAAESAVSAYFQLVLLLGEHGSGKTDLLSGLASEHGWARINVNLCLSERLLDLTQKQRARKVARLLDDIVREQGTDTTVLDNIEILFSPDLHQDPLRLLQNLSRRRTIVAVWPGHLEEDHLIYATPGHPEYRREPKPEGNLVGESGLAGS